jgi:hypothetical protein
VHHSATHIASSLPLPSCQLVSVLQKPIIQSDITMTC